MKNKKGSTLALCVIILAMLSIFVTSIWGILIASRKMKLEELSEEKGFYLSDSCISITEAKLQTKFIRTVIDVLDDIDSEEVPLTYMKNTDEGLVLDIYQPNEFNWLYTRYAMQMFSATKKETGDTNPLVREMLYFDTDPNYLGDDSISSLELTQALAKNEAAGYTIQTDIDTGKNINTNYGNLYEVYTYCYPEAMDDEGNMLGLPGTAKSDSEIANKVAALNKGLLRVTYTIRNPEGKITEKTRVTYTFDIYDAIKDICSTQSNLIYKDYTTDDSSSTEETPVEIHATPDLSIHVAREYLPPTD